MVLPFDINNIFSVNAANFNHLSLSIFHWQYQHNKIYQQWVDLLGVHLNDVKIPQSIPALPISFFKDYDVVTGNLPPKIVFESSGTTGMVTSRHGLVDEQLYEKSFLEGFQNQYGALEGWCVIALLPAYLERQHSSLVYMANCMIAQTGHPNSGFYLYNYAELARTIEALEAKGQKTLLLGVTFALLDFSAQFPMKLNHTIVMETGGMKGRGKELTRLELHETLSSRLGLSAVHGEYGMTELLSQAYSKGDGKYQCPPWMKVYVKKEDDPFELSETGTGLIQVIDLANIYSCAFIATQDIGRVYEDGSFEVLGRMDHADVRGCSLLVL